MELPTGERVPILYEDRSVLAIDKPAGWLLAPDAWRNTRRNLQAWLAASIRAGDFWARSRNLKYLRYVHRLDADTSGVLLLARSPGALAALSRLFESRQVAKVYWAVVGGVPRQAGWVCKLPIAAEPGQPGRMRVDQRHGKEAETVFRVLSVRERTALVEACPRTGRTHQIRVHLAHAGLPVLGDLLYGSPTGGPGPELALRAVALEYRDPFTRQPVSIHAPAEPFAAQYGFAVKPGRATLAPL